MSEPRRPSMPQHCQGDGWEVRMWGLREEQRNLLLALSQRSVRITRNGPWSANRNGIRIQVEASYYPPTVG